jgi:ATP-dependent DNA helicase RecQ
MRESPLEAMRRVFGYDAFRPLQEEIIEAVMAGEDALAVMPTGGGKSLCYQVPAVAGDPSSLVLVVSPLIALMREQVAFLRALGIEALLLNSTLELAEWRANALAAERGEARILYLAPETLASPRGRELASRLSVGLLAIDEAHCISEWGHDFRPEYRMLGEIRGSLAGPRGRVPCLALTATATERVREDIKSQLLLAGAALAPPLREFVAGFDRPNIFLEVRRRERVVDQILELARRHPDGSGIVYCFSRARSEALAADLRERGLAALPYHAGLPDDERASNQDAFIRDDVRIVCATTAFGMGIDKPDVRFVAHADLPKSLEQYYQEIGRAGRDGLPATALLLFGRGDAYKIRSLLGEKEGDDALAAEVSLRAILGYAESSGCRRAALLGHFGESRPEGGCGSCDVCVDGSGAAEEEEDLTVQAQKFLSCVKRTGERYGAGHVADVLVGSRNERVLGLGHSELSTWGIGKEWTRGQWMDLAAELARKGYLGRDPDYGVLSLTRAAEEALRDRTPIRLRPPRRAGRAAAAGGPATAGAAAARAVRAGGSGPSTAGAAAAGAASGSPSLERELRALRKRLAEAGRVPPYVVFSDKTLYDLIVKRPGDEKSLLGVFGMGAIKAGKYGKDILSAIASAED